MGRPHGPVGGRRPASVRAERSRAHGVRDGADPRPPRGHERHPAPRDRATSTASSRSGSATASRSRSSRGSPRPDRPRTPSRRASSCSATRTSTASTPTGRCWIRRPIRTACFHATPPAPVGPISAATAATSCSGSCARTSPGSGTSSIPPPGGADGSSDPVARVRLAAKMVGRWPSGAPLTLAPDADDPTLAEANDFAFHEHDRRGTRCPIGSHIRRSNPRDSLDPRPGSDQLVRDQPAPPPPSARSRVRTVPLDRGGAGRKRRRRPRPPLHLPERQHPAPVRVRQPHVAEQPEVRRPL